MKREKIKVSWGVLKTERWTPTETGLSGAGEDRCVQHYSLVNTCQPPSGVAHFTYARRVAGYRSPKIKCLMNGPILTAKFSNNRLNWSSVRAKKKTTTMADLYSSFSLCCFQEVFKIKISQIHVKFKLNGTQSILNCKTFDFDTKFDHSSYSKICVKYHFFRRGLVY